MRPAAFLPALLIWLFSAITALADARLTVLTDVLKLREATQILSFEGQAYAEELNQDMLGGEGGPGWQQQVSAIYDPERMAEAVRRALGRALDGTQREAVIEFYGSELGQRIVTLENSARQAMVEEDVEAAARASYAALQGTEDARLAQVEAYIASGDMISRNVTSAMNANLFFMRGLSDGAALEMTEEEMLEDVQGDMEETEEDTSAWLHAFLLLAYHPLSDREMEIYLNFARTDAGSALNAALFEGFGEAYEDISYALGRALALNMTAEEL